MHDSDGISSRRRVKKFPCCAAGEFPDNLFLFFFTVYLTGGTSQIGTLGALQVFIDTILLCTITALCMLVSPVRDFSPEAALSVFSLVLGRFGELSAGVCVALFAFASVLAWSCYGMDALLYLLPKKGAAEKRIYMAFSALSCFLGCMSPFLGVLNVCDAFNGLMALLNVPALLVLTPQVFAKQIAQKPKKV